MYYYNNASVGNEWNLLFAFHSLNLCHIHAVLAKELLDLLVRNVLCKAADEQLLACRQICKVLLSRRSPGNMIGTNM